MSSKQKGHDYSQILMIGAALVVVIRYAGAFYASDVGQITGWSSDLTTLLMAVSGIGMGFLVVFGQAYTYDGWRRSLPKMGQRWTWRFILLTLVVFLLVIVDVAILVPFTVSRIRHESISVVMGEWDWLWSVAVNVAPALLLLGVNLGNQVVSITQNEPHTSANEQANDSRPGVANKSRTYATLTPTEKYLIINSPSSQASRELRVTQRAVQKWRKRVQDEVSQGRL